MTGAPRPWASPHDVSRETPGGFSNDPCEPDAGRARVPARTVIVWLHKRPHAVLPSGQFLHACFMAASAAPALLCRSPRCPAGCRLAGCRPVPCRPPSCRPPLLSFCSRSWCSLSFSSRVLVSCSHFSLLLVVVVGGRCWWSPFSVVGGHRSCPAACRATGAPVRTSFVARLRARCGVRPMPRSRSSPRRSNTPATAVAPCEPSCSLGSV